MVEAVGGVGTGSLRTGAPPRAEKAGGRFDEMFGRAEENEAKALARLQGALAGYRREAQMTPAERIRRDVLEKLGLTEETLAGLSPEQRALVEAKVEAELERRLGATADVAGPSTATA